MRTLTGKSKACENGQAPSSRLWSGLGRRDTSKEKNNTSKSDFTSIAMFYVIRYPSLQRRDGVTASPGRHLLHPSHTHTRKKWLAHARMNDNNACRRMNPYSLFITIIIRSVDQVSYILYPYPYLCFCFLREIQVQNGRQPGTVV